MTTPQCLVKLNFFLAYMRSQFGGNLAIGCLWFYSLKIEWGWFLSSAELDFFDCNQYPLPLPACNGFPSISANLFPHCPLMFCYNPLTAGSITI